MFVGQAAFFVGITSHTSLSWAPDLLSAPARFVNIGGGGQEHRLALHHKQRTRKRRRRTGCLRCTAVALAVLADDLDDLDDEANLSGRPTVEVVLSDWLEQSRQEGRVEVISSLEEQRGGRDSSPPHRFQELIQVGTAVQR